MVEDILHVKQLSQNNMRKIGLKVPKHEIFSSRFITSSKPICLGEFRTERKNLFIPCFECIFCENCI